MTALLERHGQGGRCAEHEDDPYWSSFLVADPDGAWILETSDRTWAARAVDDGAAISNRVTLGTDWTRASADVERGADFDTWRDPRVPTVPADDRLAATSSCIAHAERCPHARLTSPRPSATTATAPGVRPGPIRATGRPSAARRRRAARIHGVLPRERAGVHRRDDHVVDDRRAPRATPARPRARGSRSGSPCASVYVPAFPPRAVPAALASARDVATLRRAARPSRGRPDDARGDPRRARPDRDRAVGARRRGRGRRCRVASALSSPEAWEPSTRRSCGSASDPEVGCRRWSSTSPTCGRRSSTRSPTASRSCVATAA